MLTRFIRKLAVSEHPVKHFVITLLEKKGLVALLFIVLWLVYCLSWFVLGVIGRLCSIIVAISGQLLNYFTGRQRQLRSACICPKV